MAEGDYGVEEYGAGSVEDEYGYGAGDNASQDAAAEFAAVTYDPEGSLALNNLAPFKAKDDSPSLKDPQAWKALNDAKLAGVAPQEFLNGVPQGYLSATNQLNIKPEDLAFSETQTYPPTKEGGERLASQIFNTASENPGGLTGPLAAPQIASARVAGYIGQLTQLAAEKKVPQAFVDGFAGQSQLLVATTSSRAIQDAMTDHVIAGYAGASLRGLSTRGAASKSPSSKGGSVGPDGVAAGADEALTGGSWRRLGVAGGAYFAKGEQKPLSVGERAFGAVAVGFKGLSEPGPALQGLAKNVGNWAQGTGKNIQGAWANLQQLMPKPSPLMQTSRDIQARSSSPSDSTNGRGGGGSPLFGRQSPALATAGAGADGASPASGAGKGDLKPITHVEMGSAGSPDDSQIPGYDPTKVDKYVPYDPNADTAVVQRRAAHEKRQALLKGEKPQPDPFLENIADTIIADFNRPNSQHKSKSFEGKNGTTVTDTTESYTEGRLSAALLRAEEKLRQQNSNSVDEQMQVLKSHIAFRSSILDPESQMLKPDDVLLNHLITYFDDPIAAKAKIAPPPPAAPSPNGQSFLFQGLNGKNTASNGFEDTPFTGGLVRMPSNAQSADTSAVTSPLFGNLGQLTDASGTRPLSADSPVIIHANAEGARDPLAVSDLAANMKDAPTIAWAGKGNRKAAEVAQQIKDNPGSNILPFIKFGLGEPEIPMSPGARAAVHAATDSGKAGYTVGQGLPSLRDAVSDFTFGQHGVRYAPDEIIVTTGLKSGLNDFFEGLFNPGERILAPQEGWPSYGDMAKRHGLELVTVGGPKENGFKPTADQIRVTLHEARLAGKPITGLVLNSPNNPSGMAYTRAEYEAIAEVMRRPENQGVKIGLDDMYSGLMYDNKPHVTLAQVAPDLANRIVTGSGASKMFMIPGERVGWLMTKNKEWMAAFNRIQNTQDSGTSYLGQVAAEGAIREHLSDTASGKKTYMQQYLDQLHNNRAIAVDGLRAAGIEAPNPDGAFYVLGLLENKMGMTMGNGVVLKNDGLFADHAREDWHIAITPFTAFGISGKTPDGFRMSLANSPENVQTGINRIGEGVSLFKK
jgi:aspartate aminotransferase